MRLPVELSPQKRTCFVGLPNVAVRALFGGPRAPGVTALKISWGGNHFFAGFAGHISAKAVVEIPMALAQCVGLAAAVESSQGMPMFVALEVVEYSPKVTRITLDPVSEDDWEIIERNAGFLESSLLDQISVVYSGLTFPIWIEGRLLVKLKATSTSSAQCEVLARNSEVSIAPRSRKIRREQEDRASSDGDMLASRRMLSLVVLPCEEENLPAPRARHACSSNGTAFAHPLTVKQLRVSATVGGGGVDEYANAPVGDDNGDVENVQVCCSLGIPTDEDDGVRANEQEDLVLVMVRADDRVPVGHVALPWSLRVEYNVRSFQTIVLQSRTLLPPLLPEVYEVCLQPVQFSVEEFQEDNDLTESEYFYARSLAHRFSTDVKNEPPDQESLAVSFWESCSGAHGGESIVRDGSIRMLSVGGGKSQAYAVTFSPRKPKGTVASFEQAWTDALETAGGGNAPPGATTPTKSDEEQTNSVHRHWRLCMGRQFVRMKLEDRCTRMVKPSVLNDDFYRGACTRYLGSRADALKQAWLQIAPRIHAEVISLRVQMGTPVPGHLMIVGPHGSGKTDFVSALATTVRHDRHCLARTLRVQCQDLVGRTTSEVEDLLKSSFSKARTIEPSVLIFDDIDTLMPNSEDGQSENYQATRLAELLADMLVDASDVEDMRAEECRVTGKTCPGGVAVVVTAKRAGLVHPSLKRRGLIDTFVSMEAPDAKGRGEMIEAALHKAADEAGASSYFKHPDQKGRDYDDIDFFSLGTLTEGYTPDDIQILVKRARLVAARNRLRAPEEKGNTIPSEMFVPSQHDFETAMANYKPSALKDAKLFKSAVQWSDVGGLESVRSILKDTLQLPTIFSRLYQQAPIKLPSGVCLFGPPGCGKTLLAGAVANECGLNFISVKGPEILNKYIGGSEENVRNLFARATAAAPSVLFFDEFDSIAPRRGADSTGVTDRVVNQLLTFLDGVEDRVGVYVMAASSRPDMIDPALLRPGRLDKSLYCGFPDVTDRLSIFNTIGRKMNLSEECFGIFPTLAETYTQLTGADIQAALYTAQLASAHASTPSAETFKAQPTGESVGKRGDVSETVVQKPSVTSQQIVAAVAAARPSVSLQDRRMYAKIYQKYLSDRGGGETLGENSDNDHDRATRSFGYDPSQQRVATG
jgi:SpoVK/Ycf46/Vps4 family AAA+-type ATPase